MRARSRDAVWGVLALALASGAGAGCRRRARGVDAGVTARARADGGRGDAGFVWHPSRAFDPHNVFGEVVAPPAPDAHPFLVLLRNHLRKKLLPADATALDALDLSGTAGGSEQAMRYKLADQCARVLVPALFARAAGDERVARPFAARLAQSKPVQDPVSAEAAAGLLRAARAALLAARARLAAESGRPAEGDAGAIVRPDESLADEYTRVAGAAEDLLAVVARAETGAATAGECGAAGDAGATGDAGAEGDSGGGGEDAAAGSGVGVGAQDDPRPFKPEGAGEGDALADVACLGPSDAAIVLASAVASDVEELSDARASETVLRTLRAVVEAGKAR